MRHTFLILHGNKPSGSIKGGEYLHQLNASHVFKKVSAPLVRLFVNNNSNKGKGKVVPVLN
jgi:hypothetical protein